jgi:hypothetical protein
MTCGGVLHKTFLLRPLSLQRLTGIAAADFASLTRVETLEIASLPAVPQREDDDAIVGG